MGFLDILGSIAGVVSNVLAPPSAPTTVKAAVATPGVTIAQAAVAQVQTDPVFRAQLTETLGTGAAVGAPSGAANIFTRTVIQRVSRASGSVVSEQVKMGSPFLMRSEVRALKRVTKAIRSADAKIPRRQAKVSTEAIDKAVQARVQQNLLLTAINHHGHGGS